MDELKRWLLNRIGVTESEPRSTPEINWQERRYAYRAVLDKINQIERDAAFDRWYDPCLPKRSNCREAWNAGHEAAEKAKGSDDESLARI